MLGNTSESPVKVGKTGRAFIYEDTRPMILSNILFLLAPARNPGLKTIVSEYPSDASPSSVKPLLLKYKEDAFLSASPVETYTMR
jgi:hypothetical protein